MPEARTCRIWYIIIRNAKVGRMVADKNNPFFFCLFLLGPFCILHPTIFLFSNTFVCYFHNSFYGGRFWSLFLLSLLSKIWNLLQSSLWYCLFLSFSSSFVTSHLLIIICLSVVCVDIQVLTFAFMRKWSVSLPGPLFLWFLCM